ncbi:hypothetical protein NliqN6_5721 [Naganishia liquefaciens]|uniref:Uncharacterized protein n=1 Tax=Naganishia liquefaciens TaxID=104408 RepID=A0A8H3YH00_9TREE|nr:hypothetical protein NliqN6_5721 [Naganishia liquefaciens]
MTSSISITAATGLPSICPLSNTFGTAPFCSVVYGPETSPSDAIRIPSSTTEPSRDELSSQFSAELKGLCQLDYIQIFKPTGNKRIDKLLNMIIDNSFNINGSGLSEGAQILCLGMKSLPNNLDLREKEEFKHALAATLNGLARDFKKMRPEIGCHPIPVWFEADDVRDIMRPVLGPEFAGMSTQTLSERQSEMLRVEMLTWAFEMGVASVWRGLSVIAFRALRRRAE